jgi:signal transduction histidine kinase
MRQITFTIILLIATNFARGQSQAARVDSLKKLLENGNSDTNQVNTLLGLGGAYLTFNPDSSLYYSREAHSLAKRITFKRGEGRSLIRMAHVFNQAGNYPRALELFLAALKLAEETKDERLESNALSSLGDIYFYSGDFKRSIAYSYKAIESDRRLGRLASLYNTKLNLGDTYEKIGNLDSALLLTKEAYQYSITSDPPNIGICLANLGNIYSKLNQTDSAMNFYRASQIYLKESENFSGLSEAYLGMAALFLKAGQKDSSVYYASLAFSLARNDGFMESIMKASDFLANYYKSERNIDSAYAYQSATIAAKDSLFSQQKANEIQSMSYEESMRQKEIEEEKEKARDQLRQNALIGGLATLLVIIFFLFLNNRQKIKANKKLREQKAQIDAKAHELEVQKANLETSYRNVELLGEIGRKITSSLSVDTIIGTVYDNVNSLMDAAVFGIGIYHGETKTIDFPATYENGQALAAYSNAVDDRNRFPGLCFSTEKEIVMGDLNKDYIHYLQQLPPPMAGDQPVSLIYLPLKVKGKMLGVLTVQSFKKDAFSDYQLYMLRNIAVYAAIALDNAESYKKLNSTLDRLQDTQKLLIQSEKMASLGELTAGIAHEIQNPLNFINNFSEVNTELIEEMRAALDKRDEQELQLITRDIVQNLEKINHHGKRADAIVKGMLQHSRVSGTQQEPTNINALADEYLRLAYHGLRAKDKTFNATLETSYDDRIGMVNIIPQDIGRVILNLITNAFYAVSEKNKSMENGYKPAVKVTTRLTNKIISISIGDNGNGIPPDIIAKIFQPFFTTKPTGQGTGLGLSLAYDIVKAHDGKLQVETKENEGSTFIIDLPIS